MQLPYLLPQIKEMLTISSSHRRVIRRWLIRGYAFTAILTYGIYMLSSEKQLANILNATFDVVSNPISLIDGGNDSMKSSQYHKHIYSIKSYNNTNNISNNNNIRISFQLHDPENKPLQNIFNPYVTCPLGKVMAGNKRRKLETGEVRSGELPPTLKHVDNVHDMNGHIRSGRVLDFTASISITDLKILMIGDSVMVQLAQAFDELIIDESNRQHRKTVWDSWPGHDGGTVTAPTRGGGVSALWRMTGLLSQSRKGKPPANSAGGGWSDKEINALTSFSYNTSSQEGSTSNKTTTTIGNFDVVVLRVMHGWIKADEITHDRLVEAISLSGELLGAKTVVLMTVPFTNNVLTEEEMVKVSAINDDIRNIATSWSSRSASSTGGVHRVQVLEYGTFYNHIIWSNARHLGYNVSNPLTATQDVFDIEGPSFLLDRLQDGQAWSPSIPMVCSDTSSLGTDRKICNRNYLFLDGMHICPESLASRYSVGLACIIGCVYNEKEGDDTTAENKEDSMRECERECNKQFMSVMPVEESWIDTDITLASFA